jgi:hypothetical protein
MSPEATIERTFEFATYVGGRAVELIDSILASAEEAGAEEPPVIIVLSDHGPGIDWDAQDPLGSDLNDRTSNFLAILSPGRAGLLPPGTTPVNVLPRVLNSYLGTSFPIQPDTVWAWPTGESILDLVPVDPATLVARQPDLVTGTGR